ncbi:MAG: universal stress protein [Candidatus Rokuibacteriota bacterium]
MSDPRGQGPGPPGPAAGPRNRRLPQREPGAGLSPGAARATGRSAHHGGQSVRARASSVAGAVAGDGPPRGDGVGLQPECRACRRSAPPGGSSGGSAETGRLARPRRGAARGAGGLARLLLGSVAEGVLDHSSVSVLLVK